MVFLADEFCFVGLKGLKGDKKNNNNKGCFFQNIEKTIYRDVSIIHCCTYVMLCYYAPKSGIVLYALHLQVI